LFTDTALKAELMLSQIQKSLESAKTHVRVVLALCFVLGAAGWGNAANTAPPQPAGSSAGFNSTFAIADFDGDRKPDLATVEVQKGSFSGNSRYSIRLQLTAGASQEFGVIAPVGGLQILVRDVNGDDALDVLVSTAWQHEQVAVLLNDGHGKFKLADPGAFPAAFLGNDSDWALDPITICDGAALIRMEYPPGRVDRESKLNGRQVQVERSRTFVAAGATQHFLFSLLGRAPPTLVFQT
jgi:hypothetical protein